jgi:hypothetical protein
MRSGTLAVAAAVALVLSGCEGDVIDSEEDVIYGMERDIASLQAQSTALQVKLAAVSIENGGDDLVFTNVNVHVRSGSGSTWGSVNGRGNLIVGYDEERIAGSDKSGSHNLVVGPHHNYTNYGGLVAGDENEVSGAYASVSGGSGSAASADFTSVSGGLENTASGNYSSVSGGYQNIASAGCTSVSGGRINEAGDPPVSGAFSHVCGGSGNTATGNDENVPP